jgi:hypothetical protein
MLPATPFFSNLRHQARTSKTILSVFAIIAAVLAVPLSGSTTSAEAVVTADKPLREMRTDRPDATESPYTVDAGHVQVEADFVSHSRSDEAGEQVRETSVGSFNLRFGVSDRMELGLFVTPWTRQVVRVDSGSSHIEKGFGDVVIRGKLNFWGNDEGSSAVGLIADVSLPTASDGLGSSGTEGALIIPLDVELAPGWGLGAMSGVEFRRDDEGSGYDAVVITTVTVGHDLTEKLGAFVELTSAAGDGRHVATLDVGGTLQVNPDLQFDVGANIGISSAAPDLELFAGFARRF